MSVHVRQPPPEVLAACPYPAANQRALTVFNGAPVTLWVYIGPNWYATEPPTAIAGCTVVDVAPGPTVEHMAAWLRAQPIPASLWLAITGDVGRCLRGDGHASGPTLAATLAHWCERIQRGLEAATAPGAPVEHDWRLLPRVPCPDQPGPHGPHEYRRQMAEDPTVTVTLVCPGRQE